MSASDENTKPKGIPPGSYTLETLPPLSEAAARLLSELEAEVGPLATASEKPGVGLRVKDSGVSVGLRVKDSGTAIGLRLKRRTP